MLWFGTATITDASIYDDRRRRYDRSKLNQKIFINKSWKVEDVEERVKLGPRLSDIG